MGWDRLRLELATRGRTHTFDSVLPTATVAVARVPAGQASLRLIVLAGESALAERSADIEVPDGDVLRLELGFGVASEDAGMAETLPIPSTLRRRSCGQSRSWRSTTRSEPQDNVAGDRLVGDGPVRRLGADARSSRARRASSVRRCLPSKR